MQTTTARSAGQAASARKSNNGNGSKSGNAGKKKKSQQPKSSTNGKEAVAPAGPRPVAPPPVSGPWGNFKPAASSAPPPGFAPSPPKTTSGFSDAHQRLLRHRALFAFRFLVGKAVELQLVESEERYAGILDCVDPDDFSIVLKNAKRLSSGTTAKPFEDGSTVIFRRHQLAHLVADGTVNYTEGVFASGASAVSGGFRTDTEISGQKGEHLFGRELETASSWLDPALDTGALEDSAPNGRRHSKSQGKAGWNQFEANEKLFGVVSTYDENIYTTKLDKTKISTEQSRAAEKLAQEIERQSAAGNFHLQEERGQTARGGKHANDLDEEARYSSVDRRGAPASGNAYVPPALRNAQPQSSGGKSEAQTTKTAPAVAAPAPPASEPTSAAAPTPAPPAAPAAPKPLSFSEAVTGRSAAANASPAAPKETPKSQLEEKKGAMASPKKEASPAQVNGKDTKPAAAKSKGSPKKKDAASGKEKKAESKAESKTESKSSSKTTTTTTTSTTKQQSKEETPKAAAKKALNPNAKEFKLNASAAAFTPSFAVPPALKEHVSSPYRGGSPGHLPYPHPGMGYPPPMQEEWMYGDGMGGEEGGEMGMPPYGYGVPMGPNGVPMMYPPMMPQQNMRMMGGQRGGYSGYQQGYNPRGYYSPPNSGYPPYAGGPGMAGVGPQPPLPPTPSGDETPADGAPAPPVPETAPDVDAAASSSKQQSSASKKKCPSSDGASPWHYQGGGLGAMLPPIHKSTNGLQNERGSGVGGGFFNDNRKQAIAGGFSSPSRVGHPENQSNGALSVGTSSSFMSGADRMAERVHALERENAYFREELQHLRHFYSSNQQQHEDDKLSVGKVAEDLQRLAHSFNSKLQADMSHQQREQQKAALLFAEVTRLEHRVEGVESELRGVLDDIHRKFEDQEQHAQFMASVSSKQQQQALPPTRNAELQRQLRDMQDAMVQLRNELDADRSARWKNDAVIDAKLDAQLERLNSKLTADKRDLARALDEQRQLVTGADFQRVTSHMREFSRVNDHLLALERWLHSEFGQIKRVFQALAGDVDGRFQCVLVELANGLKMWHAALARQEEESGVRFQDLEDAVQAVVVAVQRKLRTLEELIPLEVQARQKNDDKLRRRVEGVVKALGHAIETSRGEYLPQQSTLAHRVHQLELEQQNTSDEVNMTLAKRVHQLELAQHNTSDEVSMQHNAMRETIQAFMEDSDAMLVRLAAAVEQERIKGEQLITPREAAPLGIPTHVRDELTAEIKLFKDELNALQTWTTTHAQECRQFVPVVAPAVAPVTMTTPTTEDMRADTKRVKEQVGALQAWTTMHAQECRQFFDFLSWSMDDVRRESAVVQCLDAVIDQIVEAQTCGHLNTLAMGINGALKIRPRPASSTMRIPSLTASPPRFEAKRGRSSRSRHYTPQLPDQGYPERNTRSPASEGATDMLDLSTTTYYASTEGDAVVNAGKMKQLPENDERGEGQQEVCAEITEGFVQPLTDNDSSAADMVGLPSVSYERYSESMGNTQGNLLYLVENDGYDETSAVEVPSDPGQHNGEDEYSMEMTQDEEIKVSPIARQDKPKVTESPNEEEPLTLDL